MWGRDPGQDVAGELSYTDADPLPGGMPAVWSWNNGISLARARILFADPPRANTDPRVVVAQPWYPEWANLGSPLALDFHDSWSTSGRPVHLEVEAKDVPAGDERAVTVQQTTATLTPAQPGEHWYSIRAVDEAKNRSFPFHLSLPVFNPRLGRDDTHALLLYRFDEGRGDVVHDRGAIGPAADLHIDADDLRSNKEAQPDIVWLPGQGLRKDGAHPLIARDGMAKLARIAKTHACTVEFWVSATTIDPPDHSLGSLFSWDDGNTRNLAMAQVWYNLKMMPSRSGIGYFNLEDTPGMKSGDFDFCPMLQHVIVTWDGNLTSMYFNGRLKQARVGILGTHKLAPW